ncbi:MAG: succinylglutamate desuccinylase/aspartoacylase family protein [Candidatus Woesearchaeota archaeon]
MSAVDYNTDMRYPEFLETIKKKATDQGMRIHSNSLRYTAHPYKGSSYTEKQQVKYPLLKLDCFTKEQPILLLTAGFHGDEIAGPFTMLYKLEEIIEKSKQKNVGLIIFPCINPSGFDIRERYNIASQHLPEAEQKPNNDFMRYVTKNHNIVDDLGDSNVFITWFYSNDKSITGWLPHETIRIHKHLHKFIHKSRIKRIKGHLDLHQDCFMEELERDNPGKMSANNEGTYAYVFDKEKYLYIMQRTESLVPPLREFLIDTGYRQRMTIKENGEKDTETIPDDKKKVYSDKNGFVYRRDATITDLTDRLGAPHTAAVETTCMTPLEKSMQVYMIWITEFMELIQKK